MHTKILPFSTRHNVKDFLSPKPPFTLKATEDHTITPSLRYQRTKAHAVSQLEQGLDPRSKQPLICREEEEDCIHWNRVVARFSWGDV